MPTSAGPASTPRATFDSMPRTSRGGTARLDRELGTIPLGIPQDRTFGSPAEFVYETVRTVIHAGQLKPGHRLPEVALSEWIEVRRTPDGSAE